VEDKNYLLLIVCGQIVPKKKLDLELEDWKTSLLMTIMLLHFIQREEEYLKETSDKLSKMRRLHQPRVMIREET
jgi:hypothetical protein